MIPSERLSFWYPLHNWAGKADSSGWMTKFSPESSDPEADTTAWEQEIDRLVYELYGLTEDEIAIVEGKQ